MKSKALLGFFLLCMVMISAAHGAEYTGSSQIGSEVVPPVSYDSQQDGSYLYRAFDGDIATRWAFTAWRSQMNDDQPEIRAFFNNATLGAIWIRVGDYRSRNAYKQNAVPVAAKVRIVHLDGTTRDYEYSLIDAYDPTSIGNGWMVGYQQMAFPATHVGVQRIEIFLPHWRVGSVNAHNVTVTDLFFTSNGASTGEIIYGGSGWPAPVTPPPAVITAPPVPTMPPIVTAPPYITPSPTQPLYVVPTMPPYRTYPPTVTTAPTQPPYVVPTMPPIQTYPPYVTASPTPAVTQPPYVVPTMPPIRTYPPYVTASPTPVVTQPPYVVPTMPPIQTYPPYVTASPTPVVTQPPYVVPTMPPIRTYPPYVTASPTPVVTQPPYVVPTMPPIQTYPPYVTASPTPVVTQPPYVVPTMPPIQPYPPYVTASPTPVVTQPPYVVPTMPPVRTYPPTVTATPAVTNAQTPTRIKTYLLEQMAARSGPGVSYMDLGKYLSAGSPVTVISKVWDTANRYWWVQVEFAYAGRLRRAYTVASSVQVNASQLAEETELYKGYVNRNTPCYYGPGSWYDVKTEQVTMGAYCTVYQAENGYAQIEYHPNPYQLSRVWIPAYALTKE